MFIPPIGPLPEPNHRMLILTNTIILIAILIIIELTGSESEGKKVMRVFYPVAMIFAILVTFALYQQFTSSV